MNALTLILILAFGIIATFSQTTPTATRPQPYESFKLNQTQQQNDAYSCSYTADIKTSCGSSNHTTELLGLLFGDAYGSQVYVPSLNGPVEWAFEPCSSEIYKIHGPCTFQICYLFLFRTGDDGWIPETVSIYNYLFDPVTFYYGTSIPDDDGYGFDNCHGV